MDSGGYSSRLQSESIWEERSGGLRIATGQGGDGENPEATPIQGDDVRGMMDSWIKEDTEQDYSQTEYGKNALVVGESDGGDREHPDSSGNDSRCARDNGVVNQPFARDDGMVRGFRRIVQSETKVRKHMGRTFWCFANPQQRQPRPHHHYLPQQQHHFHPARRWRIPGQRA
jgi:hypothetical protein